MGVRLQAGLAVILLTLPRVVSAEDYTYATNNGAITITGYTGAAADLTIPETINGIPVACLGDWALHDNTALVSLSIPDSVTSIGARAFSSCTSLASLRIPNSVTNIGDEALRGCTGLTNVTLGSRVANIESRFSGCQRLTTIAVDALSPVYSSANGVLFNKNQTALLRCPEGKAGIYRVPEGVIRISGGAFAGCARVTEIIIPDSVTTLAGDAFAGCGSLVSITLGQGIFQIGDNAFRNCTRLSDVTLGSSVTNIGARAFSRCTGLAGITIPKNVTSIESRAFESCRGLTTVHCKGDAPKVSADVFADDDNVAVYYPPGSKGWGPTFGGRSATVWGGP